MIKHKIHNSLKKNLSGDFLIIKDPDHPYLISPPEILLAAPERLLAIFIIKSFEASSPYRLISRLVASKLALPQSTLCILVSSTKSILSDHQIENSFDDVLEESEILHYCHKFVEKRPIKRWKPVPTEIRQNHFLRTNILLDESQKHLKQKKTKENIDQVFNSLIENYNYHRIVKTMENQNLFHSKSFYRHNLHNISYAYVKQRKGRSLKLAHRSLFSIGMRYVIDNGIPCPHEHGFSLLLVDDFPSSKYDVWKYVRSAAFCGLTLIFPDKMSIIHKKALGLEYRLEKEQLL